MVCAWPDHAGRSPKGSWLSRRVVLLLRLGSLLIATLERNVQKGDDMFRTQTFAAPTFSPRLTAPMQDYVLWDGAGLA